MTDHFKPLWGRNPPKFGIAHAMALGLELRHDRVRTSLRGSEATEIGRAAEELHDESSPS